MDGRRDLGLADLTSLSEIGGRRNTSNWGRGRPKVVKTREHAELYLTGKAWFLWPNGIR
jgi:hypothetical protein